jgi:hypothetical protein
MWSFFRRAPIPHPAQTLLSELDALDQERQESTARQLAMLWSAFTQDFGISRFKVAPPSEQQAYLHRLDRIIERGREVKESELGRYYYSTALLRHFLEAHRTHDTTPAARAVSEWLVWLTERGRELEQDPDRGGDLTNLQPPRHAKPMTTELVRYRGQTRVRVGR